MHINVIHAGKEWEISFLTIIQILLDLYRGSAVETLLNYLQRITENKSPPSPHTSCPFVLTFAHTSMPVSGLSVKVAADALATLGAFGVSFTLTSSPPTRE